MPYYDTGRLGTQAPTDRSQGTLPHTKNTHLAFRPQACKVFFAAGCWFRLLCLPCLSKGTGAQARQISRSCDEAPCGASPTLRAPRGQSASSSQRHLSCSPFLVAPLCSQQGCPSAACRKADQDISLTKNSSESSTAAPRACAAGGGWWLQRWTRPCPCAPRGLRLPLGSPPPALPVAGHRAQRRECEDALSRNLSPTEEVSE